MPLELVNNDFTQMIENTFKESEMSIPADREQIIVCPNCKGSGFCQDEPPEENVPCSWCEGLGRLIKIIKLEIGEFWEDNGE